MKALDREAWRLSGGHSPMCGCDTDRGVEDPTCRYTAARRHLRRIAKAQRAKWSYLRAGGQACVFLLALGLVGLVLMLLAPERGVGAWLP